MEMEEEEFLLADARLQEYARVCNLSLEETSQVSEYSFKVGEMTVVICVRELHEFVGGIGHYVWNSAIVLARWIAKNSECIKGKKVLEIGCGCGLPGLLAAKITLPVWMSDNIPRLIENLHHNAEKNGIECSEWVEVLSHAHQDGQVIPSALYIFSYDWMTPEPVIRDMDFLFGADIIFQEYGMEELVESSFAMLKPGGSLVFVSPSDRRGVERFTEILTNHSFEVSNNVIDDPDLIRDLNGKGRGQEDFVLITAKKKFLNRNCSCGLSL